MSDWAAFAPARTRVDEITDALEEATDAFATELDACALAENRYLAEFQKAWTRFAASGSPVTTRRKDCDNVLEVSQLLQAWNLAQAKKEAARAKWEEQKNRLMAAMSNQRFIREQT